MTWWEWLLLGVAVVLLTWGLFVGWLYAVGRRSDARALAGFIPDCAVLVARLLRDPRVRRGDKLLLVGLAGYLALPFDLVPDFVPVAGQLDDVLVAALVMRRLVRSAGPGIVREHWTGPPRSLDLLLRVAGQA